MSFLVIGSHGNFLLDSLDHVERDARRLVGERGFREADQLRAFGEDVKLGEIVQLPVLGLGVVCVITPTHGALA